MLLVQGSSEKALHENIAAEPEAIEVPESVTLVTLNS